MHFYVLDDYARWKSEKVAENIEMRRKKMLIKRGYENSLHFKR